MLAEDDSRFRTSVGHEPETGILYLSKKNPPPIRGAEGGGERGEDMKLFDQSSKGPTLTPSAV